MPLYTEICRKNAAPQIGPRTRTHTLCEPAQSKCRSTFHKSRFLRKFTSKMPDQRESTLIKHGPSHRRKNQPLSVDTLFGEVPLRQVQGDLEWRWRHATTQARRHTKGRNWGSWATRPSRPWLHIHSETNHQSTPAVSSFYSFPEHWTKQSNQTWHTPLEEAIMKMRSEQQDS